MPVTRQTGEAVIAGSLNTENALDIEVTRIGDDTRLSAIVKLLERAQSDKPPIARMADRVASLFVAAVL
jgi:Cu2+-exporting ATPase